MLPWSWRLFTAIETLTKTEVGARDGGIAVRGLTTLSFGGVWVLELWIRKKQWNALRAQWAILGGTWKTLVLRGDLNFGDLSQKVSKKNFSMWPRDCSCYILAKNVAAFCIYLRLK